MPLEELFAGRNLNISRMRARLKQVAHDLSLPFGNRVNTYNSRLAQELGKWAESRGKGDVFHHAVFRAYFADDRNIGDPAILNEIGKSVGLPEMEIKEVLKTRSFRNTVDRDWARSSAIGVTAVPTFLINGQSLVGAQSYTVLAKFMQANDVNLRPAER